VIEATQRKLCEAQFFYRQLVTERTSPPIVQRDTFEQTGSAAGAALVSHTHLPLIY